MFDIGAAEILIVLVVAVAVIGPKDMPAALRQAGRWLGKMRRMSNHVRSGIDTMIREAEMEDMEKEWKAQNERIMRDQPEATEDIAEFEPMAKGPAAEAEEPQMRPLAPPGEASGATDASESARDPDDPPLPSELPQLPFGRGTSEERG
jgi:sec-independent protein translocase protein TatB